MKFPGVRLISTLLPGLTDVALAGTGARTVSCDLGMIPQPKLQRTKSGIWRWRIAIMWRNFTMNCTTSFLDTVRFRKNYAILIFLIYNALACGLELWRVRFEKGPPLNIIFDMPPEIPEPCPRLGTSR